MKSPSVKKSDSNAARRSNGVKPAVVEEVRAGAGPLAVIVPEARAITATGTVAVGAVDIFAKDRW